LARARQRATALLANRAPPTRRRRVAARLGASKLYEPGAAQRLSGSGRLERSFSGRPTGGETVGPGIAAITRRRIAAIWKLGGHAVVARQVIHRRQLFRAVFGHVPIPARPIPGVTAPVITAPVITAPGITTSEIVSLAGAFGAAMREPDGGIGPETRCRVAVAALEQDGERQHPAAEYQSRHAPNDLTHVDKVVQSLEADFSREASRHI
jgi:hypothetical protein